MPSANAEAPDRVVGQLQSLASWGTLIKTLAGFAVGIGTMSAMVYNHFAKESELTALRQDFAAQVATLQCARVYQHNVNLEAARASREIRGSLVLLQRKLKNPKIDAAFVADEMSKALDIVNEALTKIEQARTKNEAEMIKSKGEIQC